MTETQAREEICRIGHSLFARGYVNRNTNQPNYFIYFIVNRIFHTQ